VLTDSGHLSPTPIGRIRPARLAGAFCVLAGPPDASFQGSPILNSSIARFVSVAVSGASMRGRAIGRALMLPARQTGEGFRDKAVALKLARHGFSR